MSPGWTAFTIRCIAGSSVRAPAQEGSLAEESPRAARRAVLGGSVRLLRLCDRVRHQAPDSRFVRSAAGTGVLRPVPPSARHGAEGAAKRGGGRGSGREHVRQVRDGHGVLQVHVDPQKGGACVARAAV